MIGDRWRTAGVGGVLLVFVWVLGQVFAGEPALVAVESSLPPAVYVVLPPSSSPGAVTTAVPSTVRGVAVGGAASVDATATRGTAARVTATEPAPSPTGVHGLPFAPVGMSGCAEARFYRIQFGLPDAFDGLAWRESNCRNDVRTSCCFGLWQLYVSLHLRDARLAPSYAECGVDDPGDVFGPSALAKQRNACAAAAVYAVSGGGAWDAW